MTTQLVQPPPSSDQAESRSGESGGWNTNTIAAYYDCAPATIKKSRVTGKLFGLTAPPYRKIGRRVIYDPCTAIAWLNNHPLHSHTAAHSIDDSEAA